MRVGGLRGRGRMAGAGREQEALWMLSVTQCQALPVLSLPHCLHTPGSRPAQRWPQRQPWRSRHASCCRRSGPSGRGARRCRKRRPGHPVGPAAPAGGRGVGDPAPWMAGRQGWHPLSIHQQSTSQHSCAPVHHPVSHLGVLQDGRGRVGTSGGAGGGGAGGGGGSRAPAAWPERRLWRSEARHCEVGCQGPKWRVRNAQREGAGIAGWPGCNYAFPHLRSSVNPFCSTM